MVEKTQTTSSCVLTVLNHKEWLVRLIRMYIHRAIEVLCVWVMGAG